MYRVPGRSPEREYDLYSKGQNRIDDEEAATTSRSGPACPGAYGLDCQIEMILALLGFVVGVLGVCAIMGWIAHRTYRRWRPG